MKETNPLVLLARAGWEALLPDPATYAGDPDDEGQSAAWELEQVLAQLLQPPVMRGDALFFAGRKMTWPKRCPNLVTWAGRQSLETVILARQKCIVPEEVTDAFSHVTDLRGESGLDPDYSATPAERGWSPDAEDVAVPQRPVLELLGIVGAEVTPIVSFGPRQCGIITEGAVHRFAVRCRVGYYYMWCHCHET